MRGHYLAVDSCFLGHEKGRLAARAHAGRTLLRMEGTWPHPAEVDVVVVPCPNHDDCTLREEPTMRRSA